MQLSDKILSVHHSPIRKFNKLALQTEWRGVKIFRMNIGQPDIPTPDCFMRAIKAFEPRTVAYEESSGNSMLQDAICTYFSQYEISFKPKDIIITHGGSEALSMFFTCSLNPGDQVMIPEPFYTNYTTFIKSAGGSVVPITTIAEEGYAYADMDKLEAAYNPNVKVIMVTTPGNPTGNILSLDEMKVIGEFAKKHDLWLVCDEVYREFCYDGRKVTSFAMLEEFSDRVVIIDSISKRFSACGARIGCLISKNELLIDNVLKLAQSRLCSPTLEQKGASMLYRLPGTYYTAVRKEYESRRDTFYEEIMKVPGIICQKPGGAFYMTIKLPIDNSEDFLNFMLTEFSDNYETMMFTPAEDFYATPDMGRNEIRVAYILNKEDVKRSAELLRMGLEAYMNKKAAE